MQNYVKIRMKVFTVDAYNPDTNRDELLVLPVTLEQLRAAHDTGITTDELLNRLLERDGYSLNRRVGKPSRRNVRVDLVKLVQWAEDKQEARQRADCVWMKQRVCDLDGYDPEDEVEP